MKKEIMMKFTQQHVCCGNLQPEHIPSKNRDVEGQIIQSQQFVFVKTVYVLVRSDLWLQIYLIAVIKARGLLAINLNYDLLFSQPHICINKDKHIYMTSSANSME